MLRSLEKERYLVKLGCKARTDLKQPFENLAKEFEKVKVESVDKYGNIDDMEFEEGDLFGKFLQRFISQ